MADLTLFPLASANDEESTGAYSGSKRPIKIIARQVNFFYGNQQALVDNNMEIARNRVTAIIGLSGCGKSTHIRIYNGIYGIYREQRATGEILLDGKNILHPSYDLSVLVEPIDIQKLQVRDLQTLSGV